MRRRGGRSSVESKTTIGRRFCADPGLKVVDLLADNNLLDARYATEELQDYNEESPMEQRRSQCVVVASSSSSSTTLSELTCRILWHGPLGPNMVAIRLRCVLLFEGNLGDRAADLGEKR